MFALDEHEYGETDLVEMKIDTGDAKSQQCATWMMPHGREGGSSLSVGSHAMSQIHPAINQSIGQSRGDGAQKGWLTLLLH